jgi:hypothetical protein
VPLPVRLEATSAATTAFGLAVAFRTHDLHTGYTELQWPLCLSASRANRRAITWYVNDDLRRYVGLPRVKAGEVVVIVFDVLCPSE